MKIHFSEMRRITTKYTREEGISEKLKTQRGESKTKFFELVRSLFFSFEAISLQLILIHL